MRKDYLVAFLALAAMASALARDASAGERQGVSSNLSQFAGLPGGAGDSGVVPIFVENGEVIVDVTIDGKGPFPMMFDTGSVGWVTPEAALALGLKVESGGTARGSGEGVVPVSLVRASEMRLGSAKLVDQSLVVSPLPRFLTDRGARPPLAGFIGYELLAHFAVRLDYGHRTLTLTPDDISVIDPRGCACLLASPTSTP